MISTRKTSAQRFRALAALGAAAVVAVTLGACSSGADGKAADASPGASENSELAGEVEDLTKPLDSYPVPTDSVADVASVAGGTVFYIPITQRAPQFAVTASQIKVAADAADLKVQVCDGKGTPTDITACIKQATSTKATGIVLDSIAYDMASNAIESAQDAGIPVVISNQVADDRHPATDTFAYVGTAGTPQMVALVKWITLDSAGKGNILINEATDGHSQIAYVEDALKELESVCPDCTATVNEISSASFDQIPSATSSALLKNPDVDYVIAEFAEFLQPTSTGVQQASSKAAMTAGASALSTLQQLTSSDTLRAATAQAAGYQGWIDIDAILRLHAGQDVPAYEVPVRLFTKDTIGDVTLTEEAESTGEWFGPTTYTDDFAKLWGVA